MPLTFPSSDFYRACSTLHSTFLSIIQWFTTLLICRVMSLYGNFDVWYGEGRGVVHFPPFRIAKFFVYFSESIKYIIIITNCLVDAMTARGKTNQWWEMESGNLIKGLITFLHFRFSHKMKVVFAFHQHHCCRVVAAVAITEHSMESSTISVLEVPHFDDQIGVKVWMISRLSPLKSPRPLTIIETFRFSTLMLFSE